ncbi:ATP-binding cassette sub-family C member 10 [Tribolium madens]|uniref:ATP-binding cassette sub-family C member 10 n=1 Tax=Tribolium madens TaxID=41895 RepID=UPI001CF7290F|nr:ATP-binding cassette sub-family C member 10 [Tribolium madens]
MNDSSFEWPHWRWDWERMCGPGGLKIWSQPRHDLGLCFQELYLQIPVLGLFACASAYYVGSHIGYVTRGPVQLYAIYFRCLVSLCSALLPLLQIYIDLNISQEVYYVSYFLCAVQGITWFCHFLYALVLRKRLGLSPRGPVFVCVLWTLLFVLNVVSVRSHVLVYKFAVKPGFSVYVAYGFSVCQIILQIVYGLTLVPSEGSTTYLNFANRYTEIGETQPLLSNAYIRFTEEGDPSYLGVAMENVTWLSRLLFYWVNPLMEKGVQGKLNNSEDLYDLPFSLNCGTVSTKLDKALTGNVDEIRRRQLTCSISSQSTPTSPDVTFIGVRRHNVSLFKALHKCFWVQFYSIGFLKFIADCAGFASPLLLNRLVTFIEDKSEDIKWGYLYAFLLMTVTLISSFCDSHFNFLMSMVGLRMRGALVTTIYRKTLTVSETVLNSAFSLGEIVNFMSTDTDRIVNSCPSFHSFWSIPFQLVITLYLLYSQVGLAFISGVLFSIVLIPINKIIANKIGQLSTKLMKEKDMRVKMVTEVLRGIKVIKLYVWEQHFVRIITKLRDKELKYLKGRKYLDALCVYFWATTPVLISILTFATYVLMGNKLTAATVFTGIALLNMLISPLNAFPWVLNGLTEAWVSLKRIQRLLNLEDLDLEVFYNETMLETDQNSDIVIKNGIFNWGRELTSEEKNRLHLASKQTKGKGKGKRTLRSDPIEPEEALFCLYEINFNVRKGEFVGVIGSVGCGKSSLLSAILAELKMQQGEIAVSQVESGFGFVTQQPWLQRGTLRDNILFGKAFEDNRYKSVLFACGLAEDIYLLPGGDLTGVGEGGMTLSGGQKARVALARAVYQDKAVYLLDDILSAVDTKVARHIFQHCIMGLLKNKTKVLCTHHVNYLVHCDRIVLMENGVIKQQGKPADVLTNIDDMLPIELELGESIQSNVSFLESIQIEKSEDENDSLLLEEVSETGTVEFNVYAMYWKSIGHGLAFMILLAVCIMQTSRNMTDWWMSKWVSDTNPSENLSQFYDDQLSEGNFFEGFSDSNPMSYYLRIYIELACVNTVFTLFRAFLFAYGGVVAASKIHKLLLRSVLKGKTTFFDISPIGRILNRFSSDTYTVDDSLPFIVNILLAQFFSLLGTVVITIYGLPWICLVLIPLIPVYHWLQYTYRLTSRELKRISSVTLSPVYSHFNESLQGLTTIRAMRATQRFKRDNEENVDANIKAQFASQAAARWLGLRLQFIGVAMVSGVSFIAIIQHQYDVADPGLVGLALSYALSVTSALNGVVNAFTETEREMIAVERVNQYIKDIPPESTHCVIDPPFGWPSQGVIAFKNVVLKYREHLPPSLRFVSFETRPSEKIGVVGRTGAGKSSLLSALFRLVELYSGEISIDSVNISRVSLQALRSRLFCIPQEPFLFSGTLKENLDPLGEFRDNEIWDALKKVNLTETIRRLGGLKNIVVGGGVNFSVGQKQLICLARAVLHNAKILCIDEATANVDRETDRQIQQTLRSAFRKSTVLTIAHRVQTILDCDRVLVMHDGQVVEFDQPDNLLANPHSLFYQLVNQD